MNIRQEQSNFDFLSPIDVRLSKLGRLAEYYFHDDPSTCLIKLRQYCETLTQLHAAHSGLKVIQSETQSELLRRIRFERTAPEDVLNVLHHIRKTGNDAVHEDLGDHRSALIALKMAVRLGVWHFQTVQRDTAFSPGPFKPPRNPSHDNDTLNAELDRLRKERDAALSASQRASEEAIIAQELAESGNWTDKDGAARPVRPRDIIVVAPYNAQVNALDGALPDGIRVGTVDKFQGQEAPICLVSMTASSAEETARGMEFLFSLNRINVAVSRAKGLALVFGAPRLREAKCNTVEQMKLVNTLCALPESNVKLCQTAMSASKASDQ